MPKDGNTAAAHARAAAPPLAAGPLAWLTRRLLRRPRTTLALCGLLALAASLLAWQRLGFRTNRLDLLDPASEFHQRWLEYLHEFGRDDDVVIVVRGDAPEALAAATESLASELHGRPERYRSIVHRRELGAAANKALQWVDDARFDQLAAFVASHEAFVAGRWDAASPEAFPRELSRRLAGPPRGAPGAIAPAAFQSAAPVEQLVAAASAWADDLEAAATDAAPRVRPDEAAPLRAALEELAPRPVLLADGRHALVALRLANDDPEDPAPRAAALAELRDTLRTLAASRPGVEFGLTGMPVLEDDEMRTSQTDMTWASVLSFVGVVALLRTGFRRWRPTWLAVGTLVLGMAWSFGGTAVYPGHLNLLSVAFAAILIGLGIDFGIHYLARYEELRGTGRSGRGALVATASSIGPGVLTGAATTAIAFFAAAYSEFRGVAELGWIAGAGVLFCVAAAFVALPALVLLVDRSAASPNASPSTKPPPDLAEPAGGVWWRRFQTWQTRPEVPLLFLAVAGAASFGLDVLRYDHNLLNLQTADLESVRLERLLLEGDQRGAWFAVSLADDVDEVRRRKASFERLPSVSRVEEIATLAEPPSAARRERLGELRRKLASLPAHVPALPPPSPTALRRELGELVRRLEAAAGAAPPVEKLARRLQRLAATLAEVPDVTLAARLAPWWRQRLESRLELLRDLRAAADPTPVGWSDLPPELAERFRGANGRHLLRIYPREDVWDLEPLREFVADVESVDPRATGHPIQTFYASQQVQRSYVHGGVYALICILIVAYLDFRHLGHALLSLVPLLVTFVLTFGLAGWLRMPLNAANLLALPLLLGIGIDAGVHVIHDWRGQTGRYVMNASLALSIFLCSATTIAGFAGLAFARHQGLRSLGILLCLGMTVSLATALLFLPALLHVFSRSGRRRDA